ncbi:MAG: sulfotransferase [Candidatus Cloacimonetes bacterium]|nr:sulfotransferase [Candidatus Cloacimonadota bacterium]
MTTWENIKNNGVFVGGHRKNGTTLLIALLDGHPDLFVYPYETHFWYAFYPVYFSDNFTYEQRKQRIIDYVFHSLRQTIKKWMRLDEKDLKCTYNELNSIFSEKVDNSDRDVKDFLDAIIYSAREILPDPNYETHKYWIEKCTGSEIFVNDICKMYPHAKYIHVVRDPRDNWAVIKKGWDKHYHTQYDSMDRLLRSVIDRNYISQKMSIDNTRIYGDDRYLVIRYEDMVHDAMKVLKKVCLFLDISFDELFTEPSFCKIPWEGNSLSNIRYRSVSNERVGIHKNLPSEEIKILEYYFRSEMIHYNYEPIYSEIQCVDAVREHYKWFNANQTYSMKPIRTNYDHLDDKNRTRKQK